MLSDQRPAPSAAASDRRYLRIAQELLEAITRGDYPVGSRLPTDREISVRSGVSRATVREALLVLELIGIVEASVGTGVYVASSTPQLRGADSLLGAPTDLIEARIYIEPVVAALCAERMAPARLQELERLLAAAEEAARLPEPFPTFSDISLQFHAALAANCGNAVLGGIGVQLVGVTEHPLWVLLNQSVLRSLDDRLAQVEHHRRVVRAIAERDPAAASAAMQSHVDELWALIVGANASTASRAPRDGSRTSPRRLVR